MRATRRLARLATGPRSTLWLSLILLVALFVVAGTTHFWLVVRGVYLVAFLLGIAFLWGLMQHVGVQGRWEGGVPRLVAGESFDGRFVLSNRMPWPKPLIEVQMPSLLASVRPFRAVSLAPRSETILEMRSAPLIRGRHQLGSATVRSWDPFGLFPFVRHHGVNQDVIVLPRAELLPGFQAPTRRRGDSGRGFRATTVPTPVAGTVRPYAPFDDQRLVHWPSTIRRGELMVKTFDAERGDDCRVIVDFQDRAELPHDVTELVVTAGASVVHTLSTGGARVGLRLLGKEEFELDGDRGAPHLGRAMEALALLEPGASLVPALRGDRAATQHDASIVIVTTRIAAVRDEAAALAAEGRAVNVVVVTPDDVLDIRDAQASLAERGILTFHLRPGQSLAEALRTPRALR